MTSICTQPQFNAGPIVLFQARPRTHQTACVFFVCLFCCSVLYTLQSTLLNARAQDSNGAGSNVAAAQHFKFPPAPPSVSGGGARLKYNNRGSRRCRSPRCRVVYAFEIKTYAAVHALARTHSIYNLWRPCRPSAGARVHARTRRTFSNEIACLACVRACKLIASARTIHKFT